MFLFFRGGEGGRLNDYGVLTVTAPITHASFSVKREESDVLKSENGPFYSHMNVFSTGRSK